MTSMILGSFQVALMLALRPLFFIFRKRSVSNLYGNLPPRSTPVVFVANHQHHMDPPALFCSVPIKFLFATAPLKFMAWHRYYWSPLWLIMYPTGCFPTHGPGHSGIKGMAYYAQNGYRTFIFPEGKTEKKRTSESKAYTGVSRLLKEVPNAEVVLLHHHWEKRQKLFSRPRYTLTIDRLPDEVDRKNADEILAAVYASGASLEI